MPAHYHINKLTGSALCLLMLGSSGCIDPIGAADDPDSSTRVSVYVIGDSISIDYHPYLETLASGKYNYDRKGGIELARKDLDRPNGANGGDSSMALAYLRESLAQGDIKADYILINCGLHDIKTDPQTGQRQVPLPDYQANLRAIIELVRSAGKHPVWITTTPVDENRHQSRVTAFHRYEADLAAYNKSAAAIMKELQVPVIELFNYTNSLGLSGDQLYRDHVHFQQIVCEKQALFIHHWILGHLVYRKEISRND